MVWLALLFWAILPKAATFVRNISGPGDERAVGVIPLPDKGFLVVGTFEALPDTVAVQLVRTDSLGFLVWKRSVVEVGAQIRIHGVCFRGPDTIVVVGEWKGTRIDRDMYAAELDSVGSVRWQRVWGAVGADDVALGVCPTHDNGWLVAGYTLDFGQYDVRLALVDSAGNEQMTRVLRTAETDYVRAASKAANRNYALAGTRWNSGSRYSDGLLLVVDDTCALVRSRSFGGPLWDEFSALALLPDSGFVLVGFSASESTGNDVLIQLTDSTGQGTRQRRYGQQQSEKGHAVAAVVDGFAIAGETFDSDSSGDARLLRLDRAGILCWERTDGGSGFDCLNSVVILPGRGVVAAGQTWDDASQTADVVLICTDEWGTVGLQQPWDTLGQPAPGPRLSPAVIGREVSCAAPFSVVSADGRLVRRFDRGGHWNGTDVAGRRVPSGVYIVQRVDGGRLLVIGCGKRR